MYNKPHQHKALSFSDGPTSSRCSSLSLRLMLRTFQVKRYDDLAHGGTGCHGSISEADVRQAPLPAVSGHTGASEGSADQTKKADRGMSLGIGWRGLSEVAWVSCMHSTIRHLRVLLLLWRLRVSRGSIIALPYEARHDSKGSCSAETRRACRHHACHDVATVRLSRVWRMASN